MLELMFILDASDFSRLFEKLEPLPTKNIHINKDTALTHKKLIEIIAYIFKYQKIIKNNRTTIAHTHKTEIVIEKDTGKII